MRTVDNYSSQGAAPRRLENQNIAAGVKGPRPPPSQVGSAVVRHTQTPSRPPPPQGHDPRAKRGLP
ncbi:hypothetical protein BK025_12580 [Sodalis sp. TME1]|nr:hypothetical protein BK025_12580 [Sodalis sp. TME1]